MDIRLKKYTKQELVSLFLICALPLHVWSLFLSFFDFPWVIQRTDLWDAVGVLSYNMLFTLFESVLVFFVSLFFGLLLSFSQNWKMRVPIVGMVVITFFLASALFQLGYIIDWPLPIEFLMIFPLAMPILLLFAFRLPRFWDLVNETKERFLALLIFYICIDVIGIVVILIRNIDGAVP